MSETEAIAAMVARLRAHPWGTDRFFDEAAALLAQVARERDEAVERITRWRAENGGRYWEARFRDEEIRAEAAERQLAEARAETLALRKNFARWLAPQYRDTSLKVARLCDDVLDRSGALLGYVREEARALLSGETT